MTGPIPDTFTGPGLPAALPVVLPLDTDEVDHHRLERVTETCRQQGLPEEHVANMAAISWLFSCFVRARLQHAKVCRKAAGTRVVSLSTRP